MTRSVFTERYKQLRRILKQERKKAKLTQWELAKKLNMPLSYVSKYEQGERRIDVVELLDIAQTIGFDTHFIINELLRIKSEE